MEARDGLGKTRARVGNLSALLTACGISVRAAIRPAYRHKASVAVTALTVLSLVMPLVGTGSATAAPRQGDVEIKVLSNRADLVAAGDALVQVVLPPGAGPSEVRVYDDGRDVTSAFAVRPDGRFVGLVTGLSVGRNVLTAQLPGRGARITITNHPNGGPVFSGSQLQPWFCTTSENGLGPPQDSACNAPTDYDFFYISTNPAKPGFQPYDPDNPPDDVATTTTDQGETVPFIVRRERGTADRGIYQVAVLYNPEKQWEPWRPQRSWNHKLHYPFGASCGTEYSQGSPEDVLDRDKLGQGFMVANSSLNVLGTQCNTVISAEAAMMLQERIAEQYGHVRYTIGTGCSGGSIGQQMVANAYPGLIDGILPNCSYEDNWSTGAEVVDCHMLLHYFNDTSPQLWPVTRQRAEVMGHASVSSCQGWEALFANRSDPDSGCSVPEDRRYDAATNPRGARCTLQDYHVSVLGRRPASEWTAQEERIDRGFAKFPYDNVGVQYGLRALQSGLITPAQFVDLNAEIGSVNIDFGFVDGRREADPGSVRTLYRTGQFNDARRLDRVPVIDLRGTSNFEIHTDYHSYAMRQRLIKANGHHKNQIIWTFPTPLIPPPELAERAFQLMDRWLANIEADTSDTPLAAKVARAKPAGAVDACFVGGRKITDRSTCRTAFPYFASPRIAAGGPPSHDVAKCRLQPLDRDDYPVEFTDEQWSRLQAAFPQGVCDYSKPAVGKTPSIPWLTYEDGPGGRPLGDPPVSEPYRGRGGGGSP